MDNRFLATVESIYDAALDPARLPDALQAVADYLGEIGAILLWRRDDGTFGSIASPSVVAAQADYERNQWMATDLRALRAAERGYFFYGDPFTDRHVCSDEEIAADPVYADFQARHGLKWFAAVPVSPDPHVGVVLSVHRCAARPPFADAELATLAQIGRHMERSLRLGMRLFDADVLKIGLGEALNRVGIGVFGLDSLGRVVSANPAGERLLGDGLALVSDRLQVGAPQARRLLSAAIGQLSGEVPEALAVEPKPILIDRRETGRPLAVYVLPVSSTSHPAAQFLSHARSIVLVIDPESTGPADPAVVRDVLGLTLGEARVAALVGAGIPPREASERLGISAETGRSVLKQVFAKTGVSRQSELAMLLNRIVIR